MRTYELKKQAGVPLYEALYRAIRQDILSGALQPGQKLPSKRSLSAHLEVSKITVEGAYNQLLSQGYIRSEEKIGYFVENVQVQNCPQRTAQWEEQVVFSGVDLTGKATLEFPFSVWSHLQRQVMLDMGETLLASVPNQGVWELRQAIANHLADFRGMQVDPRNIVIGAGTDFLYNLVIQLLGTDKVYALEEPGYGKIRKIYESAGATWQSAYLDAQGIMPGSLQGAQVLHCSASHHFPTGLVTGMGRRQALLQWAYEQPQRYIIEDDYDSEFRFSARPVPAMVSMDRQGRVIYMNTFSRSLAPSIRIGYVILPDGLMAEFQKKLGFYSCTVSSFDQYTLARFLSQGQFEKHINRQRKRYKARRNRVLEIISNCPQAEKLRVLEQDAGLHFLLQVDTDLQEEQLAERWAQEGLKVRPLSSYYYGSQPQKQGACLVINYAGLQEADLNRLELAFFGLFG